VDSSLLGCDAVSLGAWLLTFSRILVPSSSKGQVVQETYTTSHPRKLKSSTKPLIYLSVMRQPTISYLPKSSPVLFFLYFVTDFKRQTVTAMGILAIVTMTSGQLNVVRRRNDWSETQSKWCMQTWFLLWTNILQV